VQSIVLSFPEVIKEETLEKDLKCVNSYFNHLLENFDNNLNNEVSPLKIIDNLNEEYYKGKNRNETIDTFYKLIKKIDNQFIKLNNLKSDMEKNNLKSRINEDDLKKQINKLVLENQALKEGSKIINNSNCEIEKLQILLKESEERLIETEKKYLKSVEDLKKVIEENRHKINKLQEESKEQSLETKKRYLKLVEESKKEIEVKNLKINCLQEESKEQFNKLEEKYSKWIQDLKKEIDEKNQNNTRLQEICKKNSLEINNLNEQIKNKSQDITYNKLYSFCKFLNEKVVFPNINDESLLKFVRNQANNFSKDEKDKIEIQPVEYLFEKIEKLIANYKNFYLNDFTDTKNKQTLIESDNKVLQNEISKINKEKDLLNHQLRNANLENSKLMNLLDEKKSEIFILKEENSDLSLKLKTVKENTNEAEYYKHIETFLMKIKEKLMNLYSTAINFSSFVKDENEMKDNYRKNMNILNKNNDVFFCVENLINYLFETIKKLDEIDLLKVYEVNVSLIQKYKICNFCDDLKDKCHFIDLCDKHSICFDCYNKDYFEKCINCGYKSYHD
jgi:hypothetical protein